MTPDYSSMLEEILASSGQPEQVFLPGADRQAKRRLGERIRGLSLSARRFFLDDEAASAASALSIEHPEVLTAMLPMARAPFDLIWVEWSLRAQLDPLGLPSAYGEPARTGVFVQRISDGVYRSTEVAVGMGIVVLSPVSIVFDLNGPVDESPYATDHAFLRRALAQRVQIHGITVVNGDGTSSRGNVDEATRDDRLDGMLRSCFVGMVYTDKFGSEMDQDERAMRTEQCRLLMRHATWTLTPGVGTVFRDVAARVGYESSLQILDAVAERITETSGQWRMLMSVLCMLNSREARDTAIEVTSWKGAGRRMVKGRVLPRVEFGRVTLRVPRTLALDTLRRGVAAGIPRRRHEVSGHWCESHVRGNPDCEHTYVDETPRRRLCIHCGHLIWWRESHERGDESLGRVVRDRVVKV